MSRRTVRIAERAIRADRSVTRYRVRKLDISYTYEVNPTCIMRRVLVRATCLYAPEHNVGAHPRGLRRASGAVGVGCGALMGGRPSVTLCSMTIKARVRAGRLVLDEPTDLPDGTEVELLPLDPGDWLDDADRAALHEALRQSEADVAAGRLVDADAILRELRSR